MEHPKKLDPEAQGQQAIAVAITVTTQISDKRNIVMQTFMPRDAEVKDIHDVLDKLGKAVDRQEAKYGLEALKANLEVHEKTLKQLEEDFTRIGEASQATWAARGKKGAPELNANERAQKTTTETNIKRYRTEILRIKADIAQHEATVAKVD